jgi:hypothetical protein
MIKKRTFHWLIIVIVILLTACGGSSGGSTVDSTVPPSPLMRSFYMGFTPWPYDATLSAISYTYTLVQESGDVISHHLMSGVPWEESYTGAQLPNNIEEEISSRINQTESDKIVFLSIDSLNTSRNELAPNWGVSGEEPRSEPWDTRNFDDPEVAEAYSNFALNMIDRFNPAYFNYAPEVSELILNDPVKYNQFLTFAESVYQNIKGVHPDLPLMVSIALKSPGSIDASTIESSFSGLSNFVDIVGISVYPYAFYEHMNKGDPANMPSNWISQISSLAGGKPVAITETGWIAENLAISNFGYFEQSNATLQSDYVSALLESANSLSVEFVIWFAIVDYDALWNGLLGQDDLSKLWKDTGLLDESLNGRPAFDVWDQYYSRDRI